MSGLLKAAPLVLTIRIIFRSYSRKSPQNAERIVEETKAITSLEFELMSVPIRKGVAAHLNQARLTTGLLRLRLINVGPKGSAESRGYLDCYDDSGAHHHGYETEFLSSDYA